MLPLPKNEKVATKLTDCYFFIKFNNKILRKNERNCAKSCNFVAKSFF